MKIYDFDGMFDEKLSAYVAKNAQKYSESEWEDVIPQMYKRFGDTVIKSLGKTPREYYGDMSGDELISCLKTHLKQGVSVPVFLSDEIEKRKLFKNLLPLLDGEANERAYAMSLLGANDGAIKKYMELLVKSDEADFKDRCAELIKEKADLVAGEAVEYYKSGADREYMLEIMSRVVLKRDEIFDILLKEFRSDPENIPMHASYLAAYADERALEYLYDKIDEEGISFVEFRELKYAIEALGGRYEKERDFSSDPYYSLIKGSDSEPVDILSVDNKKN